MNAKHLHVVRNMMCIEKGGRCATLTPAVVLTGHESTGSPVDMEDTCRVYMYE